MTHSARSYIGVAALRPRPSEPRQTPIVPRCRVRAVEHGTQKARKRHGPHQRAGRNRDGFRAPLGTSRKATARRYRLKSKHLRWGHGTRRHGLGTRRHGAAEKVGTITAPRLRESPKSPIFLGSNAGGGVGSNPRSPACGDGLGALPGPFFVGFGAAARGVGYTADTPDCGSCQRPRPRVPLVPAPFARCWSSRRALRRSRMISRVNSSGVGSASARVRLSSATQVRSKFHFGRAASSANPNDRHLPLGF